MAFLLRDIPGSATFKQFNERYPSLDPASIEAFLRLMRVGSDCLELLDRLLEDHDLLHGRWITMILLMREHEHQADPSNLAEKQGVSRPTMTGLLERLERDGLIERVADPQDGRRFAAKLTRAGVAKLDGVMPG
ncbi:MAG: MarR family winged helix-turn-helix transcriptional regulator, partial [Phycisphaerae bacterium]